VLALGLAIYFQPVVRCFSNPLGESELSGPCADAAKTIGVSSQDRAKALLTVASDRMVKGNFKMALEAAEEAEKTGSTVQTRKVLLSVLQNAAGSAMAQRDYVSAIAYFTRVLELDPANRQALNQRGLAF